MNKKTFTVAVIFLIVTLVWLGVNIFWALSNKNCIFDLIVAVLFLSLYTHLTLPTKRIV